MTKEKEPRLRPAKRSVARLKDKLRDVLRKGRGKSLVKVISILTPILRGWSQYFKLSKVKQPFIELDEWIRHRLRAIIWRHWRRPPTRYRKLLLRGLCHERAHKAAYNGYGPWLNARTSNMNIAFPKAFFSNMGLISLLESFESLKPRSRTAVYGSVRTVV